MHNFPPKSTILKRLFWKMRDLVRWDCISGQHFNDANKAPSIYDFFKALKMVLCDIAYKSSINSLFSPSLNLQGAILSCWPANKSPPIYNFSKLSLVLCLLIFFLAQLSLVLFTQIQDGEFGRALCINSFYSYDGSG